MPRFLAALVPLAFAAALMQPAPVLAAAESATAASVDAPPGVWVAQTGDDRVRWAWTAVPGATGYRIAVSTSATMSNPIIRVVEGRWATFTGLRPGRIYYAAVRSLAGAELSGGASVKVAGIAGAVAKPLGGVIKDRDAVAWRWAPYVGATRYQVWLATSRSGANAKTYVVSGRTINLGVERDSTGYFKVRALDANGSATSAWSPISQVYVPYHPV